MMRIDFDSAALLKETDRQTRLVLRGALNAVQEETRGLEQDLEKITQLAVPGRLYKGWQSGTLKRIAKEPSGWVYFNHGDRSQGAITFWTQSGRVKAQDGGWLAIPLPAAGARGKNRDLTPAQWEARTGNTLRPVFRRGKPGLLVLDEGVLSGKKQVGRLNTARRRASGRGNTTVPIFVLIPFQDFANAFSVEPLIARRRGTLPDTVERNVKAALAGK